MRRWRMKDFQLCDLPAMESYLQRMAGRGWMLENVKGGNFYVFRKTEPQQLTFSAEVVGNMSTLGADECEEALDYRNFCEQAGWQFVCANRLVQIFCAKAGEEPLPIETDEQLKFDSTWKQLRKTLWGTLPLTFLWVFYLLRVPYSYSSFLESNTEWASRILLLLLLISNICVCVKGMYWYLSGRRALTKFEKVRYFGEKEQRVSEFISQGLSAIAIGGFFYLLLEEAQREGKGSVIYTILYFVILLGFILFLQNKIRKSGFSKGAYSVIVILGAVIFAIIMAVVSMSLRSLNKKHQNPEISAERILTLEDLGAETENEPWIEEGNSIFGSMLEYWNSQSTEEGDCTLEMQIYRSKSSWLLQKIKEDYEGRPGHLLEKDGSFGYISFEGDFGLTEEEILERAMERL